MNLTHFLLLSSWKDRTILVVVWDERRVFYLPSSPLSHRKWRLHHADIIIVVIVLIESLVGVKGTITQAWSMSERTERKETKATLYLGSVYLLYNLIIWFNQALHIISQDRIFQLGGGWGGDSYSNIRNVLWKAKNIPIILLVCCCCCCCWCCRFSSSLSSSSFSSLSSSLISSYFIIIIIITVTIF